MKLDVLKLCTVEACRRLKEQVNYLSSIDAETGDGDHGITIGKIAEAIEEVSAAEGFEEETIADYNDRISLALMQVNGGAAGPLWAMLASGVAEALTDEREITPEVLKRMFQGAVNGLEEVSSAKPGDKTMLDALKPAQMAAARGEGGIASLMEAAAEAAKNGAEATKDMVAKFGRAKNLHEKSLGHLDPGAVSVSLMIQGLWDEMKKREA